MMLLVFALALSACAAEEWSDEGFQDAAEYCEESLAHFQGNPQCDHTLTILRDDLGCPLDAVYEFFDLTSRLDYEGGRILLENKCDDPSDPGLSSLPDEIEITDEQLIPQISTWVNQLGLDQTDPIVWRRRLERACTEGVWEAEVARQLAEEFIAEDLAVSVRGEGLGPPSVEGGAQALWIMAVNVCRDVFPDGEIEDGPTGP